MANTRTRKPKTEMPDERQEMFFDPMATGVGASHGAAGTGEEDEQEEAQSQDPDGDGSEDEAPTNPLERTVAGMSEGTQAAQAELREYLRRKANLLAEKQAVADDIKQLDKEFKVKGYDMKAMALLVKIDNLTDTGKAARREQNSINATYAHAAGIDEDLL